MQNFLQVNRALAAEKNLNYFNLNQIKSNPDGGQTCDGNRQSRLMSYRCYLRNLAIIFAILTLSMANIATAWGYDVPENGTYSLTPTKVDNAENFEVIGTGVYHFRQSAYSYSTDHGIKTKNTNSGVAFYLDKSTDVGVTIKHTENKNAHTVTVKVVSLTESQFQPFYNNRNQSKQSDRDFTAFEIKPSSTFDISITEEVRSFTGSTTLAAGYYAVVAVGDKSNTYFNAISFAASGCSSYEFHYQHGSDWNTTPICFSQVGSTTSYLTDEMPLPYAEWYNVTWDGSGAKTQTRGFTGTTNNVPMPFYHRRDKKFGANPQAGNLGGGLGRFHVYSDSKDENKYVSFVPTGYTLNFGTGDTWTHDSTLVFSPKTENWDEIEWYTPITTLTNAAIERKIFVGLKTELGYVWCSPYSAKENISGLRTKTGSGDSWLSGGMSTSYAHKTGKFRIYANSGENNWYVTFVPHYKLTYNANGGSGAPEAAYVSVEETPCQWSLSTTHPTRTDYEFLGWSTNPSATVADADAEVADLGKPYGATGDVTLYAVWQACSGPNADRSTWTAAGYTYAQNATANEMSLTGVTASNGGDLSYQWYKTTSDVAHGEAISGATSNRYTPATDVAHAENWFYFCRVTEAGCSKTYTSALSGAIVVNAASLTALECNTLYKVADMVPASITLSGTGQYGAGLSANTKFEVLGDPSKTDQAGGTPEMKNEAASFAEQSFNARMYLKGASNTTGSGTTFVPTSRAVKFIVGESGTLDIYAHRVDRLYLKKVGDSGTTQLGTSTSGSGSMVTHNVTAGTYYIYATNSNTCIYGVRLNCCSTPAAPTAFAAGSITSTGATFTITDAGDAASYDIYYATSNSAPDAGTAATTTSTEKTKTVTGLTANTTYYAWVRSVCDADHKSAWVALGTTSFTTAAAEPEALVHWTMNVATDGAWGTTATSTTDGTNISSISTSHDEGDNKGKSSATAKTAMADAEVTTAAEPTKSAKFTFTVKAGKKVIPEKVTCEVFNVSTGNRTYKAQISDNNGHVYNSTNTVAVSTEATLTPATFTFASGLVLTGNVTVKVYAWKTSGSPTDFRMGQHVKLFGEVDNYNCTALNLTRGGQESGTYTVGNYTGNPLTCTVNAGEPASYQWKQYTQGQGEGEAVNAVGSGSTTTSFTPNPASANTYFYACEVTDICGNTSRTPYTGTFVFNAAATYTVTHSLTNVTATSGATGAGAATEGVAYDAVFAANSGYVLPSTITVTIGGSLATVGTGYTWNASTGAFQVPAAQVTGDIVVTIAGETAPATKDIYYGAITITAGALTKGSTGTSQFFTNIGGTVANTTEISLSSTPSTGSIYYNSNDLTDAELSKSSNWSSGSSSDRYIRGLKWKNGTSYTLALGDKTATSIKFYGWCGNASKVMTVGGETFTSNATKNTFETHDFTKSGDFTGNVSITQTGDFYGIIVVTVAALPFCTTPTMPSDVTSTICEADSKPTWNATPENAATITGASQTISYSWKKEGSDTELATTATYTPTTNGTYKCTVTVSKASHISRTAVMTCTLVINSAPDKPTISGNTTGTVGNNVLLTASTTIAAASYQWYKDGVAIGSATSATYNANEASAGSYDYTVTATNSCGTSSASNAHTVTFSEAAENVTPIISASLESACVGATITLTATTYHPSATLTWYKDGVTTGQTGTTYTISTAAAGDAGVYTLKSVLGGTEDLTSDGITITINTAPAAFSDFRTAYSVDAEATSVTLNATATGATSYAWYSATKENATTGGVLLAEVTTTSYSASLAGVAEGKEYYFYCIAENACGNNSAAATTVTVTAVSLEECLDMTDASDAGASELEGTYATLSGTTSGKSTVSSLTYIKLGSSSNYIQLEAETGYTFATVTAVLVANYSNQKMVYATSTNGSSWTYTEHTLSGDAKVRRTLVIDVPANTKYVQIWRQADGKGQANTLYVDPEICYEMEMECATPPTFQFEKPASTKITADSYTMGSGAYTSPMLNKGSLAGSVTYSSSDESVATVNSSGVVTILDAGSTTIKAIYAGDATYCTTQAYYVLTVSCQIPAPELTTDGSSVACSSSITITARNSSTHAAYAGDAAGGTYEWYRNGEVMAGEDDASITVEVTGTYYVVYTKDDCSQRSTNVATVTSEVREPSAQRLTPFQYYKYNHTYYQVGDPDIPGGTDPDIVGPMRHLFKVTPSRLVDGKPCQVKKEIIRADVSLGAPTVVTDSYIKYEDNKDGSYNVMLDLNALTTLNKVEERLVLGDTLVLTATPFDACSDPATSETKSIKVYVIDESKHPLAFIVSGASGDGTKTKSKLVLNGDFLTGYNKADLCLQTGLTDWNPSAELPLYTGLKADPKFIVVPVNGYATFNQLNYEPFELLLLTDFVVTDGSGSETKSACASIVNDMAALVDYRPILSLKAHMAKTELANWAAKGFTTSPEVPENNPVNTMKVLCYAHPMFDGASGAVTDPETGLTTITMTSGGGFDKNKALQGFQSAGLSGFVFIASIDGGSKGTLYSCIERQNKIDARMVVISVNGNAHSQINSYGQSAIIKTLEYLLDTDPVKVSDCTVTFDNGASYADYNEEAYHAAGGTGSKGDGLWATAANWSTKKLPLADQNIKINADVTVTGDRSVLSVRFNDNYKMTIAPSGSLSVPGYISKVVDGELVDITETNRITIQSSDVQTGVLIHSQKSGTLAATVQLVSKSYSERVEEDGKIKKKKYWQYIGLPVQSALAEDAFYGAYTYKYDETSGWKKKGTGSLLEEFWGIGLSIDNDVLGSGVKTFNIAGNLAYATDREIELTKTAEAGKGENMIGNSWTAPIHLVNMTADDFENATATIYIYNTGRDEQAPGGDVGTSTFANGSTQPGQWISIPVAASKLDPWLGPKVIPAMQAFEVDVKEEESSGTLHLNYDKHVRNIGTPEEEHAAISAPKRYRTEEPSMMRLRVADTATYTDLYLIEGEELSDEFDNGWDGKYQPCDGRSAALYALSPIGNMAVLAQQSINNTAIVFRPGRQNEYTFTFGYNGEVAYYLNDLLLEQSTQIREGNEYRFTCNEGDMESRFVVSTTPFGAPDITTGIGNTGHPEKVQKIMYKDHIYIIRAGRVYDIVGKEVR